MRRALPWAVCLTSCVVLGCTKDPVNIGNDGPGSAGTDSNPTGGLANAPAAGGKTGEDRDAGGPAGDSSIGGKTHGDGGADTGGAAHTGGKPGTGGTTTTGGVPGAGGMTTGGTGGDTATGGSTDTGGSTTGGAGGSSGEGGATEPALEPAAGQHILFELAYSNFAMDHQSQGLYVTADGSVYKYSTPVQEDGYFGDLLLRKDQMTEEEVTAKYGSAPELQTTVPESELLAMFALVAEARTGELFVKYCGNDGGVGEDVAWLYDPSTSLYSPVLLGTGGDTCLGNSNPAADTIMNWLCTLSGGTDCTSLGNADCAGATCSGDPPTCLGANRPSVVDGCWDTCVPNTWCKEAPSCDDCTEYQVCVITPDGKSHCSDAGCRYENCPSTFSCGTREDIEVTCDCAGAEICSGGRAWCKQLDTRKFSCKAP
jgi:hypothetical protein